MKTINDIKNAVLSGNRVFWKNDSYEVIKDSKNQWMIAFRQGQSGENYVGLTYRDGVKSDYNPKDFYIKGKSVNMKTKTNFATTSDVRNLINATMETFPKGPERDGIQTKMFNFWDNLNAGNNLPAGSDRNRFIAESKDNLNAARRTAQRLDNEGNNGCDMKVTVLASKLTGIKVGKNEMAKVEDNFYGKRVVKGIFAKAKFAVPFKPGGLNPVTSKYQNAMYKIQSISKNIELFMKESHNRANVFLERIIQNGGVTPEEKSRMEDFIYVLQPYMPKTKLLSSRTGSKAKFAKEYILWAVPKGKTDTMYSQPIAEQLYTDAQINEAKRKATAAGWHTFRIDEVMSFEDMTNLWKGKPVKRRSSRTGAKAKFANEEIAMGLSKVLKIHGFNAMASEVLSGSTDSETLRKYIRALKSKMSPMSGNDRGMVLLQTLEKQLASRTGSKAKFDKSNYYALEGTVDGNATGSKTVETIEEAMYYGKAMLEHMKKQSPKAKVATVHIFKVVNYQRENTPVKVLNSRTGAKVFK